MDEVHRDPGSGAHFSDDALVELSGLLVVGCDLHGTVEERANDGQCPRALVPRVRQEHASEGGEELRARGVEPHGLPQRQFCFVESALRRLLDAFLVLPVGR